MAIPPFGTPPTPDATTTKKGKVKLAGDLGGTADLPTVPALSNYQPLDADLTDIAGLTPSNDDIIQRKAGAWTNRTMAQLAGDLTLSNLGGSVTDAQVPNTITLDNITQITTRPHSSLTSLTTGDDHTQYALLAGRATPQQFNFGTASGASTGYLSSTAHATKGKYFLNAAGTIAVDELNTRLGINVASPTQALDISGNQLISGTIYGDTAASGTLILRGTSDVTMGRTDIDKITLFSDSPTLTAATGHMIRTNGTITLNGANLGVQSMVMFDATVYQQQSNTLFGATLFNLNAIYQNEPNTSGMTLGALGGFVGQGQIQAVNFEARQEKQWTFMERFIFGAGSGTVELFNPQWYQYYAANQSLGNLRTGGRVLNRVGFYSDSPSVAGTGILHNNTVFGAASQTTGRDFNYFIYGNAGLSRFGDDVEIDSTTTGLILHDATQDSRYRYRPKAYTGAIQSAEVAFDPIVDIPWVAFYRADSAYVGGVADGADITRWQDKSGNGRDLELGTGTDVPIYDTVRAEFNNKPAVEFTAANSQSLEYSKAAIQGTISQSVTYTIIALVSFKTVAAAMRIFNHTTTATRGFGITATPNWDTRMGGTAVTGGTPATATRYYVRVVATSGSQTLYVDEVSTATNAVASVSVSQIVVGAHKSGVPAYTTFLNGYIPLLAIYAGDLSAHPQYQRILEYFNTEYGFALTTTSVAQGTNTQSLIVSNNTTSVGNVGIGEDDLITYSLPANYLSATGDSVSFEASFKIANSINAKRLRFYFGATNVFDSGAAGIPVSTAIDIKMQGRVTRTGTNTEIADVSISTNNATLATYTQVTTGMAVTLTSAVTMKATGEAVSNDDIIMYRLLVGVDGT